MLFFGYEYVYIGQTTNPNRPYTHRTILLNPDKTHFRKFQNAFDTCYLLQKGKPFDDWYKVEIIDFTEELRHLSKEARTLELKCMETALIELECDKFLIKGHDPSMYVLNELASDYPIKLDYSGTGTGFIEFLYEIQHEIEDSFW